MNMKVDIGGIKLKNPVVTASGTFGFGREYAEFYDLSKLGGIVVKGLTLEPREGN
ncbi:MAG TPA: dihydroorotate dehydrogenase, partial [Bacillota bacterium]|nr:dihydroorotate dehydrogenase [Bacillota bacterium]